MTPRNNKSLVDEVTTLRRHLEASHSVGNSLSFKVGLYRSLLLGKVSELGEESQLFVKAARRCQEAQGGSRRSNPHSGP